MEDRLGWAPAIHRLAPGAAVRCERRKSLRNMVQFGTGDRGARRRPGFNSFGTHEDDQEPGLHNTWIARHVRPVRGLEQRLAGGIGLNAFRAVVDTDVTHQHVYKAWYFVQVPRRRFQRDIECGIVRLGGSPSIAEQRPRVDRVRLGSRRSGDRRPSCDGSEFKPRGWIRSGHDDGGSFETASERACRRRGAGRCCGFRLFRCAQGPWCMPAAGLATSQGSPPTCA